MIKVFVQARHNKNPPERTRLTGTVTHGSRDGVCAEHGGVVASPARRVARRSPRTRLQRSPGAAREPHRLRPVHAERRSRHHFPVSQSQASTQEPRHAVVPAVGADEVPRTCRAVVVLHRAVGCVHAFAQAH